MPLEPGRLEHGDYDGPQDEQSLRRVLAKCRRSLLAIIAFGGAAWWWHAEALSSTPTPVEGSRSSPERNRARCRGGAAPGVRTDARALYEWFRWRGRRRRSATEATRSRAARSKGLLDKMVRGDETLRVVRSARVDLPRVRAGARQVRAPQARQRGDDRRAGDGGDRGAARVSPEGASSPTPTRFSKGRGATSRCSSARYRAMNDRLDAAWR